MTTISQLGEKVIIREIIGPLLNATNDRDSIGDDAAIIRIGDDDAICVSTDRVPSDLISFRLGIIDYFGLGNYLAVLNLSDIAAMGCEPIGLLLNLGLPSTLSITGLESLLKGAQSACGRYGCKVLGGDMSSAMELSISATSIGRGGYRKLLRRHGASIGDRIYCSGTMGLASTAFRYFLKAKPRGLSLPTTMEDLLADQFRDPTPKFKTARALRNLRGSVTAMDNTDGAGQTLYELAERNSAAFVLTEASLPIHEVTREVAAFLRESPSHVALGPGADFALLGTFPCSELPNDSTIHCIGTVIAGEGVYLETLSGTTRLEVQGWNYFSSGDFAHEAPKNDK